MVTITEISDDEQGFHIPRTTPAVVGIPGGRSARPQPPTGTAGGHGHGHGPERRRNYPRHDRILELDGEESDDDDSPSGLRHEGLTEAEMRRLASKSGIMSRLGEESPDIPALFQGIFLAIPMALVFAGLRYAVRAQYQVWHDYSLGSSVGETLIVYLCSVVFTTITTQYSKSRLMGFLLGVMATGFGCAMVYATEIDKTYGAVMRTPGLAVLWIYAIARGNLAMDTISLILTYIFYATDGGRSLFQSGTKLRNL